MSPCMAHEINKILEIDVDTDRDEQVQILQLSGVGPQRKRRQPDGSENLLDNVVILINALGSTILQIEAKGLYPKGAAMRKAVQHLTEIYVDASCEITNIEVDKDGNRL